MVIVLEHRSKLRAMVEKQRNNTGSYNGAAALNVDLRHTDALARITRLSLLESALPIWCREGPGA
jgi:hypothetical protein